LAAQDIRFVSHHLLFIFMYAFILYNKAVFAWILFLGVTLEIFPQLGTVLGGTPIQLSGPCFDEDDNITCVFNSKSVEGKYLDKNVALCVSPQFEMIGRITLRLLVIQANRNLRYEGQAIFYSSKYCTYGAFIIILLFMGYSMYNLYILRMHNVVYTALMFAV